MTLKKLSNKFLHEMVKCYSQNQKEWFDFEYFQNIGSECPKTLISNSISLLKSDGFVNIFYADGIPYSVQLLPSAISSIEENTLLWL